MNLYHYTNQDGFIGILKNQELWATKIQYLNDNNEYSLAFSIAAAYLRDRLTHAKNDNARFQIERFIANIESVSHKNICVCSLTEEGDLLSQWRGYANVLGGYSIGFDYSDLKECLAGQGFELHQCVYEKRKQEEIIKNVVDEVLEKFAYYPEPHQDHPHPERHRFTSESAEEFCDAVAKIAPIIKDENFKEEKEWRIVNKNGLNFENLEFRVGKSMLTPYFKIKLNNEGKN